jgi:hypothetical protein
MNETIDEERESEEPPDKLTAALTKLLEHISAEQAALGLLEDIFEPKPAKLAMSDAEAKAIEKRTSKIIERFGGPPRVHLMIRANDGSDDGKIDRFDEYPAAAMSEVVNMFHRTRRSVCRAQMTLIGAYLLKEDTAELFPAMPPKIQQSFIKAVDSSFWEHTETAYIRIASYWDRIGQILDFTFFSIRQYERDGFTAVMDRIRSNFVPMDAKFAALPEWKALREFQMSEKEDGLKWLLRRRNLLVHSLYLRPLAQNDSATDDKGAALLEFEFNHLEQSLRKKLAPGSPSEEIGKLNLQLQKAADLYPAVLGLCEYAADRR